VISLEPDLRIRTANEAAGNILGVDLEAAAESKLADLAADPPLLRSSSTSPRDASSQPGRRVARADRAAPRQRAGAC
jgi:hypothetical protein